MSTEVLMSVPTEFAEQIFAQAKNTGLSVADTLRSVISNSEQQPATLMQDWSDGEVLAAADLKMPPAQDARHSELLQLQQARKLAAEENAELANLHEIYMAGNLHKARGLLEAVRRHLR